MRTKTIMIDDDLNEKIKKAVKVNAVKKALVEMAGYKNAGEGELIRRALATGLSIEIQRMTSPKVKREQE